MMQRELVRRIMSDFKYSRSICATTLRAIQGKQNISIYRKYKYVNVDDPLPNTPEFKEQTEARRKLKSFTIREHIEDLCNSRQINDIVVNRASKDSISMIVFIERVQEMIFFTRGRFTQDSSLCAFLSQEYNRNPFMYLLMMYHTHRDTTFANLLDDVTDGEMYLTKTDVEINPLFV